MKDYKGKSAETGKEEKNEIIQQLGEKDKYLLLT